MKQRARLPISQSVGNSILRSIVGAGLIVCLTAIAGHTPPVQAQEGGAQPLAPPIEEGEESRSYEVEATAVLLDVIVRDRRGNPVLDLEASDFEVFEDGRPQRIDSFELIRRGLEREVEGPIAAPRVSGRLDPIPGLERSLPPTRNFVAFVFDRLSTEGRRLAARAALDYLQSGHDPDTLVGVFALDLSLHTLQLYTSNLGLIQDAIERAGARASVGYTSGSEEARQLSERSDRLGQAVSQSSQAAVGAGQAGGAEAGALIGPAVADQAVGELNYRMLQTYESLERDQQGYSTANGLLAVVDSLRVMPGRKTVLFFSEGVSIPPNVQHRFKSIIHTANRSNVSIYTLDAAGLRMESSSAEAARELRALANRRIASSLSGRDDTSGPMTRTLERNEDLLRLDPHSGLTELASETGGFLISETNSLKGGLERIGEDMNNYYMLSYSPTNRTLDGKFRNIDVKVGRPGLTVQSRKGYYATPIATPGPLLDYEAPALAVLSEGTATNQLPIRVRAFDFPSPRSPSRVAVLAEVPAGIVQYEEFSEHRFALSDFSILVLVHDDENQLIEKLSRQYRLFRNLPDESPFNDAILYFREIELPPGKYRIEAVAYDAVREAGGLHRSELSVMPHAENPLCLSSVAIIKGVERMDPGSEEPESLFHFGESLLYPVLEEPLSKKNYPALTFFFRAEAPEAGEEGLTARIRLLQEGKPVGQMLIELAPPDEKGRVDHAGSISIEKFPPGSYELVVAVTDGRATVSRAAPFQVAP